MDIGTGTGLAAASGTRPFLPPLLTGVLARNDVGIDLDGTDFAFLESTGFLFAVLVLAVVWYLADRQGTPERALRGFGLVLSVALGALLFAGALASGGHSGIPGLFAGAAVAALVFLAVDGLLGGAARRLDGDAARFLVLYADAAAVVLTALAIFVPPVSFLALIAFVLVLLRGRTAADRKYAGLRILR